ncbi:MAG TPA: SAM-dependent methyltransferase [Rhizomicrobium sp.]|nr:SAM-dependent methyltransferase [Rhizomicrobium sp.]
MTALAARIAAAIAAQGPISIAEFMTMALLDPADGYYATKNPLGADFITAPETSQMFGELIGLWLAQCWHDQGKPKRPMLVELGPGTGALMSDALRALKLMPEFRGQLDIFLVEASPMLREAQREALKVSGTSLHWADSLDDIPKDRPLFLIANEFFDALPIRQYVKSERGWCERMVMTDDSGALAFALAPAPIPAASLPANRDGAPPGGVYETSPAGEALAEEIGHRIASVGGAALIVDYGYDAPGFGETLQAVAGHAFANVLAHPGETDLSAHVDFHTLYDAAVRGGASVCGPVDQGDFLVSLGIVQRAERLATAQAGVRYAHSLGDDADLRSQLDRLLKPEEMGTLFKALAIVPKSAPTPPGFS